MSLNIAVVYHSGYGHTDAVAEKVAEGAASVDGVEVIIVKAGEITSPESPEFAKLDSADAMIFGSPTYMGSAAAAFKGFMEASSTRWMEQQWANKLAAGFTNSGSMNGDKQNTLVEFMTFAMQHSMIWVGLGQMPGNNHSEGSESDLNRCGASIGCMTQANVDQGGDVAPPDSDRQTAVAFGARVAEAAKRWGQ
ncbi:NADPH-dependent fmn reductase [Luminiphilus syltensis NOR5-1B]|uniref:NADPH-dependent fmn reductase n=1 Tax=Luminiphilus syltensis NOR5-1B TaxID=565045 RepID=B8KSG1_9GAMM|nr:flavodoxin family protein [Luminiphilus syltensis]EED35056.1 NADPH-dependent fmn reductase [Luminiphilus syltensis NOR5-1B]